MNPELHSVHTKTMNDAPKKICANENPNSGISYKKDVLLSGSPLP